MKPLTDVTRSLRQRLNEHERVMRLAPSKTPRETERNFHDDEIAAAADEILIACGTVRKECSIVKSGGNPDALVEFADLFQGAVKSFAQAVKGNRKTGALHLMREAISSLDRLQKPLHASEPPPAP